MPSEMVDPAPSTPPHARTLPMPTLPPPIHAPRIFADRKSLAQERADPLDSPTRRLFLYHRRPLITWNRRPTRPCKSKSR